jgi:hypothetical protein
MVKTRQGFHRYYQHPGYGITISNRSHRGEPRVDVRGDTGQVAAPWSIHKSGAVYEPVGDWTKRQRDLPLYDEAWLSALFREPIETDMDRLRAAMSKDVSSEEALVRATQYMKRVRPAATGSRHMQAFKLGVTLLRGFALDPSDAFTLLREWNSRSAHGARKRGKGAIGSKLVPVSEAVAARPYKGRAIPFARPGTKTE